MTATRIGMSGGYALAAAYPPSPVDAVAVLVPVKAFGDAKLRLAPALAPNERAELARRLAEGVLAAARPLPVAVVCEDDDVAAWAATRGALVVHAPGRGLNAAVGHGVKTLAAEGIDRVIVAHADLPLASEFGWLARFPGVTLVPDHRNNGTNVVCIASRLPFDFSYGPGSFVRHRMEAMRRAGAVWVVRDARLMRDVDEPADLALCN
jgi:2-phospho-L-lactate/phosphoenolpyruvate guanylyltransferase